MASKIGNVLGSRRAYALGLTLVAVIAVAGLSAATVSATVRTQTHTSAAAGMTLAQFTAKLTADEAPWTKWEGPTTPVTPPKSFNLAIVTCFSILHGCVSPANGACDAAKVLGWKCTIFDGKDDPTIQASDIEQAITDHANAIITVAVDGDLVKAALARAKAANIPVISTSNGSAPGQQGYAFDTSPNLTNIGAFMADWMVVQTQAKGPILPMDDLEFQSNIAMTGGEVTELQQCTTCKVYPVYKFTAGQLASAFGPDVVEFARTHPGLRYVVPTYDPAAAVLVPVLKAAGMSSVHVVSQLGDAQNLSFIKQGEIQDADGAWDNEYEGWATVDQIIRLVDHKPLWVSAGPAAYKYGENIPYILLTKANLPPAGTDWHASVNYQAKFKALWGVK